MSSPAQLTNRDTIPRVQHIGYFHAALSGIENGFSYDELRLRLRAKAAELGGRITASRVEDAYTYWSPTSDSISELMRLGLVESHPLPSKRTAVDSHRDARYQLTESGHSMLRAIGENESAFRREITPILICHHPYLAALCNILAEGPILIPEYTEEELKKFKEENPSWARALATDASERMKSGMPNSTADPARIHSHLREWLLRRFRPGSTPSNKEVLDAVMDALVAAALEVRGLACDATSFNILSSWGRQLFIINESRYVDSMNGRAVWSTAEVVSEGSRINVIRRTLSSLRTEIINALAEAYRTLADKRTTDLGATTGQYPYLEIYAVRALTAFRIRVNDPVVDRIIAEINQGICSAPIRIELALGSGAWAGPSESKFRIGSRRYNVILVKEDGEENRS